MRERLTLCSCGCWTDPAKRDVHMAEYMRAFGGSVNQNDAEPVLNVTPSDEANPSEPKDIKTE